MAFVSVRPRMRHVSPEERYLGHVKGLSCHRYRGHRFSQSEHLQVLVVEVVATDIFETTGENSTKEVAEAHIQSTANVISSSSLGGHHAGDATKGSALLL